MKKAFLLLSLILITGCTKKMVCTKNISNQVQNYKEISKYEIYYEGKTVKKLVVTGKYKSNNDYVINYFETYLEDTYEYKNKIYKGYDFQYDLVNNGINYKLVIDYNKADISKMIKDNEISKENTSNNKVTLLGLIDELEKQGISCND